MPPVTMQAKALSLVAYRGDAKTLLAWDLAEDRRDGLAGFTIACRPPGKQEYYLWNQLQFEHPDRHAQDAAEPATSSINAPFHKFRWLHVPGLDHQGLEPVMGTYTYTVTPRYFDADGSLLALDPTLSTSVDILVDGFEKDSLQLSFTRGYVQSQAYVNRFGSKARVIRPDADLLYDTSDVAGTNPDGEEFTYAEEYAWLGFTARTAIFALLDEVLADPQLKLDLFAYDLSEPDIIKKLLALAEQGRVRVILDNAKLHHDPDKPRPEDKFEAKFKQAATGAAEIKRGKFSRYAHDKVMVVSSAAGAEKVLTGSTNFSVSGLYINSNHVLVFNDEPTAQKYADLFQQVWEGEVKASPFIASELSAERFSPPGGITPPRTITFSPHSEEVAAGLLDGIVERVDAEGAKHDATASVLFAVMGLDGSGSVYPALKELHGRDDVFSYGVSDDPGGIALYVPGKTTGVLVTGTPTKTKLPPPFNQVPSLGFYHQIHHKFVICGFNGDDPVVYCGSSNLALAGEQENGDNLIEIHDGDVATAFTLEALALVDHFQFLNRLSDHGGDQGKPPASKRDAARSAGWFLSTSDRWAQPYFDEHDLHCIDRTLFAAPLADVPPQPFRIRRPKRYVIERLRSIMSEKRWLPLGDAQAEDGGMYLPWVPQTLVGVIDADQLKDSWTYLVLDEIVGDRVGLSIARWPGVDDQGRLRFGDSSEDELLGVPYEGFRDFIHSHRVVMVMTQTGELDPETAAALRERDVRIGDVFATHREVSANLVGQMEGGGGRFEISDAVRIYDISYEAREQAKLAAAAAVVPPLDHEEARYFLGEEGPGGNATEEDGPDDDGPGGSKPPESPKPVGAGPGGEMVAAEQVTELGV